VSKKVTPLISVNRKTANLQRLICLCKHSREEEHAFYSNLADGVIFCTDGSLCESRAGAGVFLDTLDRKKSYALGSLVTVFQTDAITVCSDYFWSTNMLNITICIYSDSKAALLALSIICNFV
jgi:hypothetical protein